jgi:hypothetical protein
MAILQRVASRWQATALAVHDEVVSGKHLLAVVTRG